MAMFATEPKEIGIPLAAGTPAAPVL